MTTNIGSIDRLLRIIIGFALVVIAAGYWPGLAAYPWAWIGVVPLLTGFSGWCPAYTLLGVSTCPKSSK